MAVLLANVLIVGASFGARSGLPANGSEQVGSSAKNPLASTVVPPVGSRVPRLSSVDGTVVAGPQLASPADLFRSDPSGPDLATRFQEFIAGRPGQVSVAVYDAGTGTTVTLEDPAVAGFETASTVKLSILLALLERAGPSGILNASELRGTQKMINVSDNAAASRLWASLGGSAAMNALFQRLGMNATTAGSGGQWGLTHTTAADQLIVLKTIAYPNEVLSEQARHVAMKLLSSVVPSQRWGVPGGVPPGVAVEVKNGWLYYDGGWVIASLGYVHGRGRDYVMAVHTRDNPTMQDGIDTVEGLSRIAWNGTVASVDHQPP